MNTPSPHAQDIPALFQAIATHFHGWTLTIENNEGCYNAIFSREDGAHFILEHSQYVEPEFLRVYGRYPTAPRVFGFHTIPGICISHHNPPEKIAKSITRRFLNKYLRVFKDCLEAKHQKDTQRERGQQNFATLAAVLAHCPDSAKVHEGTTFATLTAVFAHYADQVQVREGINNASLHLPNNNALRFSMALEASYSAESVKLTFNDLPVPIAKRLLEVISDYLPSEA